MRNFYFAVVTASLLLFSISFASNADTVFAESSSQLDGGLVIDNRTYLPLRDFFGAIGTEVVWDQASQTITATQGQTVIVLEIDSVLAKINDQYKSMDVAPRIINSKTYVPVRFISETLGLSTSWDAATNSVTIVSGNDIITISVKAWEERPATTSTLHLSIHDLVMDGFMPNENINNVVAKFKEKYPNVPIDPFENDGITSYLSGDPTPSMAYFVSFDYEADKLVAFSYEHFKLDNKGLNIVTSKGVKPGSTIQDVYSNYGKTAKEEPSRMPEANYLDITYDIVLTETNQKGTLQFHTRYGKQQRKDSAIVYGVTYQLEPEKIEVVAQPVEDVQQQEQADTSNKYEVTYRGVTISEGMTAAEVYALLGEPDTIKDPRRGAPPAIQAMLPNYYSWEYQWQVRNSLGLPVDGEILGIVFMNDIVESIVYYPI